MSRRDTIQAHVRAMASEVFEFIKESEPRFAERWVPATHIKDSLGLHFVAVPASGIQYGERAWLFQILARILEDGGLVEYKKVHRKVFYRSKK